MAQQEVQNGGAEKVASAGAVTFTAVKPQLLVEAPKANDAVQFYKAAFGAEEVGRSLHPKRKAEQETPLVLSAELQLGGFTIFVSDLPVDSATAGKTAGGAVVLCLETDEVEAAIAKAVAAGAVAEGEVVEGEGACCVGRVGKVKDPYGFLWSICSSGKKCASAEAEAVA
ncbi:Glyoxalase-like domain containing protein [Senna tora]|uniref:Glyoxalase-like domain containing protein n=1 Tax=Senna tora TaxID=362788 RepID=A0A834WNK5_9FABA|nr:Glyoxalase-like domain containing protein [Senna tora]